MQESLQRAFYRELSNWWQAQRRRPLSEYRPEPDVAAALEEAAAREGAGGGGQARLHLVVLGHVDAGKSTLMGRLLHELGCAPCS